MVPDPAPVPAPGDSGRGFVLFCADWTSEHFKGCIALANIPIDDHRLLVSMNPNATVLNHPLAISRLPQSLLYSFLNLRQLQPFFVLSEDECIS
jgi:hypothetical protein